MYASWSLAKVG
uniref:Uncharacterized protein n=1 Tax=Oryza meridionalis TaxID=40149 RepID=A0A0E0F464_9ORYZ